jgi:integration host factor subunit beta
MTKSELVRALSQILPELQQRDVELAVNHMLEQMITALEEGERIEIRGFGAFAMRQRPPRIARNPKTGESVDSPAKVVIHFKPGKKMRDRVNNARDKCDIAD